MQRKASAVWQGDLKGGKGTISTASGALSNTQYSFSTRFENGVGTNPEELIAAAHAGCFSMALSAQLGSAGFTPDRIDTTATVTMEKNAAGWEVTASHLDVKAQVPLVTQEAFETAANNAKAGCPISRLLNAKITMTATLQSSAAKE
jgi:osmotically inducible protein OsmC